ncbi:MAG TPA: hypothetical protein VMU46_02995 [Burkholderiales bacterium]|nr:hypothetical protein [Burkholderiales bacterium]
MTPITLERYLNDPGLGLRLYAEARRERAATLGRLLHALLDKLTPRPRQIHWIARLG